MRAVIILCLSVVVMLTLAWTFGGGPLDQHPRAAARYEGDLLPTLGDQIVARWQEHELESGSFGMDPGLAALAPLPEPPARIAEGGWQAVQLSDIHAGDDNLRDGIILPINAFDACDRVALLAAGYDPVGAGEIKDAKGTVVYGDLTPARKPGDLRPAPGRTYDCVWEDSNGDNSLGADDRMYFVYAVR